MVAAMPIEPEKLTAGQRAVWDRSILHAQGDPAR
jgi:hypothetical protein